MPAMVDSAAGLLRRGSDSPRVTVHRGEHCRPATEGDVSVTGTGQQPPGPWCHKMGGEEMIEADGWNLVAATGSITIRQNRGG